VVQIIRLVPGSEGDSRPTADLRVRPIATPALALEPPLGPEQINGHSPFRGKQDRRLLGEKPACRRRGGRPAPFPNPGQSRSPRVSGNFTLTVSRLKTYAFTSGDSNML
jgi:hypothetical protein